MIDFKSDMTPILSPEAKQKVPSGSRIPAFSYRPEIDGLRALAVLAVVFFHAKLGFSGGYVGVDVFFVISGYLITSLILRDLERGTFSFPDFWERRVRRILPALSAMVMVTLAAGWFLLPPVAYKELGESAIAQAAMVANLYYRLTESYFGILSEEKPLLHTWSLAVEEQFYIVLPMALWLIYRWVGTRSRGVASWMMVVGLLGSLGLAVGLLELGKIQGAFYLLPARAWELLVGASLAFFPTHFYSDSRSLRESASWLGLAGILIPVFFYTKATSFPGLAALPVCFGAMLVIWSNRGSNGSALTVLGRILAWRPIVFIGLISYSLYLWHWPVFVYTKYWSLTLALPVGVRLGLVLLSIGMAVLSWRFIETPFRKKRGAQDRRRVFSLALASVLTTIFVGLVITTMSGLPERMPASLLAYQEASEDWGPISELSVEDIEAGRLYWFGDDGRKDHSPKLLLWGDSHAMQLLTPLDQLCREKGIAGVAATRSSLPPLLNGYLGVPAIDSVCPAFSSAVLDYIKRHSIRYVVLGGFWQSYEKMNSLAVEKHLKETIEALEEHGCKVWVVMAIPTHDFNVPRYFMRRVLWEGAPPLDPFSVELHRKKNSTMYRLSVIGLPAHFIDPLPAFLNAATGEFDFKKEETLLYRDSNHLTSKGAMKIMLPLLRRAIGSELSGGE